MPRVYGGGRVRGREVGCFRWSEAMRVAVDEDPASRARDARPRPGARGTCWASGRCRVSVSARGYPHVMTKCSVTTKAGRPCPVNARPSGLCHVHDPAVQCGVRTKSGRQCAVATGGGRCKTHTDPLAELEKALAAARQAVTDAVGETDTREAADRRRLTKIVGSALLAMRAEVWPDAAPARPIGVAATRLHQGPSDAARSPGHGP